MNSFFVSNALLLCVQVLLQNKRRRRKRQVKFSQDVTEHSSLNQSNSNDESTADMDTDGYLSSDVDNTDVQME